ncbi:transglycosylase SLT domain-containing protein [Palleronia caenipelagi]|uniref:ABC transporter permease n=1 Tax=Palleronia caenipelagi TaxID=2489174 RepID=A0A547QAY6_9RHOB|nr:transglycosylase SLT domain-containing protein [Palleronia caenipelagi]TRD23535.1 ABC transporter permease [Palleronia caenipelagi]
MRTLLAILSILAGPIWAEEVRPKPRPAPDFIPVTRWDHRSEADDWSRAALQALKTHGRSLVRTVPRDIAQWCPGYEHASDAARRAFWVGLLSGVAKYESTWNPRAVGGGQWYGLMQIWPTTARHFGCRAQNGAALKDGSANLSCAIRILSKTIPRDGVVHARSPRWSGVAADWAPMRKPGARRDIRKWVRGQHYCQLTASPRPVPRPVAEIEIYGPQPLDVELTDAG